MKGKIIIKRIVSAAIVCVLVVAAYLVSGYGNAETVKRSQARTVEDIIRDMNESVNKTMEQDPSIGLSGNPYDYVEGNQYFDELVERGLYGVPAMMQSLKQSQYDGLTEYLIVIAIEEVTETDLKSTAYAWNDAKSFVEQFEQVSDDRIALVQEALDTNKTEASLAKELEPYGVIGMEALNEIEQDTTLRKKYRTKLETMDDYVTVTEKECKYMRKSFLE